MEAYSRPIRDLGEELRNFVGRSGARVFWASTDALLFDAVAELAMGFEHHADNVSPFVRLDEPHTADGLSWDACAAAVREAHARRHELMEARGYALPALVAPPSGPTPLARFAATLAQVLAARCEPLRGLVLVLAPGSVADGAALEQDLVRLTTLVELAEVRFVVVSDKAPSAAIVRATTVEHARAVVDEEAAAREMEARLEAAAAASPMAPGPAQVGAAWPRGAAPPSERLPWSEPARAAALASAIGVPAALFGGALREVRTSVLRAALALRRRDPIGATRHQSRAAQLCAAAGLDREACLMDIMLATYLVHAGENAMAEGRYRGCAERARDGGWFDLSAQSLMAVGSLRILARDRSGASVAYAWAGRAGRDGRDDPLAIEGFRMAGQLAAEDGNQELAGRLFGEAIAIATGMPAPAAGRTSAPMAGRQLAEHCDRLGLGAQAASLRAQADAMDTAARTGAE